MRNALGMGRKVLPEKQINVNKTYHWVSVMLTRLALSAHTIVLFYSPEHAQYINILHS